ncbi:MAG TPA: hypothetical protein VKF16_00635 [Candidatus Dormibacteraeota bacterium]|nr:hypothetical protein [Candidatus Dormibacteraeota bacterium]
MNLRATTEATDTHETIAIATTSSPIAEPMLRLALVHILFGGFLTRGFLSTFVEGLMSAETIAPGLAEMNRPFGRVEVHARDLC